MPSLYLHGGTPSEMFRHDCFVLVVCETCITPYMKGHVLLLLYMSAKHVGCLTIRILQVLFCALCTFCAQSQHESDRCPTTCSLLPALVWFVFFSGAYDDLCFDSHLPTNLGPLLPY